LTAAQRCLCICFGITPTATRPEKTFLGELERPGGTGDEIGMRHVAASAPRNFGCGASLWGAAVKRRPDQRHCQAVRGEKYERQQLADEHWTTTGEFVVALPPPI